MQQHFLICNKDIAILDERKYETFLKMQQHFLICNKDIAMLDGKK
jgi:hypothetical protein